MKILVTGGLGFIGSNFIRYILSNYNDIKVLNVDNLSYGSNKANLKDLENHANYSFIKGDIVNFKLICRVIKNVDVVVNFAAETHVDRSIANPHSFIRNNIFGVFTILEAIRSTNSETVFLQVSTDEVYGSIKVGSFKETDNLNPSSPYSSSKAAADLLTYSYFKTYGLKTLITRCTNNFGPYQFPEKLIPKTIIRAKLNLQIPIYGTGKNIRDWIYVEDHCKAIDLILNKGKIGEIYNISSGNEISNLELVKKIIRKMDKPKELITFVNERPGHDFRYSLNSHKIRKLGWKPLHDFDDALEKTVDWYLKNEWWWKPLLNEKVIHPTPWKLNW